MYLVETRMTDTHWPSSVRVWRHMVSAERKRIPEVCGQSRDIGPGAEPMVTESFFSICTTWNILPLDPTTVGSRGSPQKLKQFYCLQSLTVETIKVENFAQFTFLASMFHGGAKRHFGGLAAYPRPGDAATVHFYIISLLSYKRRCHIQFIRFSIQKIARSWRNILPNSNFVCLFILEL